MKRNPTLWSTLRQPLRSALFLLVIAVASFAFVARAVEYLAVNLETERLKAYYRPSGYLEPTIMDDIAGNLPVDPAMWDAYWLKDVTQGVPVVEDSPYVDWLEQRRYCSGVLQGMQNTDLIGYSSNSFIIDYFNPLYGLDPLGVHVSDVLICGTLVSKGEWKEPEPWPGGPMPEGKWFVHKFLLQVDRVEIGYKEYVQVGHTVPLLLISQDPEEMETAYAAVQEGQRYLVKAQEDLTIDNTWWTEDEQQIALRLKPVDKQGDWFYPMAPGRAVDWEDPALEGLQEEMEVLRENQSAMAVIGVRDMGAMPSMLEADPDYFLTDGRWLDAQDDRQARRVCVVHRDFAALRGLAVGDTLTLQLRDLKAPLLVSQSAAGYGGMNYYKDRPLIQEAYIVEGTADWDHWKEYPTQTETFEIVGLYGCKFDIDHAPYSSGTLNLYIPDACMPEGYGQEEQIHMGSFSFRLRSAEDMEAFLQEVQEPLAALGLRARLIDKGWANFAASARPIQRATALNAGVFALVSALVLSLFAFLYLRQKRREFAIQRALGVPKRMAVFRLLLPVSLLGLVGIAVGGLPAWGYALGKAGETLTTLQNADGMEVAATLSAGWLFGLCAMIFTVLLAIAAVGAGLLARRPVLVLLQDEAAKQAWRRNGGHGKTTQAYKAGKVGVGARTAGEPAQDRWPAAPVKPAKPTFAKDLGLCMRYFLRHIRRAPLKSILTVTLALCFLVALGWMSWTIERNEAEVDRLYRTTQVTGEIIRGPGYSFNEAKKTGGAYIPHSAVETILKSGFVQSEYLEAGSLMVAAPLNEEGKADYDRRVRNLWARSFDQPEVFFATDTGKGAEVEYAPGWDETLFTTREKAAVLPDFLMQVLDVKLGQEVYLMDDDGRGRGAFVVAGQYSGAIAIPGAEEPILLLPLGAMQDMQGRNLFYAVAEFQFDPAKNREVAEFRAVMNRMNLSYQSVQCQLKDEVLREVVEPLEKNLSLMAVLYPVTIGVSTLIGLGLALLLVIQSAREAAILRVLGTPRSKTCAMLGGGQTLLCLVGLLLGMAVLILLRREVGAVLGGPSLLCAGLYLADSLCGTVIGAAYVTKDKALALLQVKE